MRQPRCRTVVLFLPHSLRKISGVFLASSFGFTPICAPRLIEAVESQTPSSAGSRHSFLPAWQRLASGCWRTPDILAGIDLSLPLRYILDLEIYSSQQSLPTCSIASTGLRGLLDAIEIVLTTPCKCTPVHSAIPPPQLIDRCNSLARGYGCDGTQPYFTPRGETSRRTNHVYCSDHVP